MRGWVSERVSGVVMVRAFRYHEPGTGRIHLDLVERYERLLVLSLLVFGNTMS